LNQKKHSLNPNSWIKLYADYLYNYTIQRVNNHEKAEDIVQDTFLAALNAKNNFKGNASERTWLVAILKRKIVDHYRKINSNKGKAEVRMAYVNTDEQEGDWLEERVAGHKVSEPDFELENSDLGSALDDCLDDLPAKSATVFKMKTLQQMASEDICNELDITSSNLWVIIHRARVQLMDCMKTNWYEN
jgi:RNA polymerase sigma-70 factor (ECF subfamily)